MPYSVGMSLPSVLLAALLAASGLWAGGREVNVEITALRRRNALLAAAPTAELRNQIRAQYRAERAVYRATQLTTYAAWFGKGAELAFHPHHLPAREAELQSAD